MVSINRQLICRRSLLRAGTHLAGWHPGRAVEGHDSQVADPVLQVCVARVDMRSCRSARQGKRTPGARCDHIDHTSGRPSNTVREGATRRSCGTALQEMSQQNFFLIVSENSSDTYPSIYMLCP